MEVQNNALKESGERMEALVIADKSEFKRPPCPECGSHHIKSHGVSWICCDCGRDFVKVRRQCANCPYKK